MSKHTILFLAANPLGTTELALGREVRAIQEELERSGQRDRFEFVTRWAVQPLDLIRELRRLKPTVVHFSGHGESGRQQGASARRDIVAELGGDGGTDDSDHPGGLFFQGSDGRPQLVTAAALRETFGAAGASVKLVVLNACHSDLHAEALLVHIDFVVGMGRPLRDDAAKAFAIGLYGGLGEQQSVEAAYLQGCAAISLEKPRDDERPQLRVRDGVDANQVVLSEVGAIDRRRPTPVYPNAEVEQLSKRLEAARGRRDKLRSTGIAADHVDHEILELRRELREGGRLRPGDSLGDGRYLLVKVVGSGGFAVVWEAFDCATQQRVAIKVLHTNLSGDPQRCERFFRGAQAMMRLTHRGVTRVLEPKGEDGGFYYFVMEFVSGGNLRDAVLARRVNRDDLLPLIIRVGEALALAQASGMVHRDVKPTNILLDEHGNAKLTDFDLVSLHDTTGGTRTGALGTVVYAAPECLEKPQEATTRADVYGLGMTAIFCLSGGDLSMNTFRDPDGSITELDCSVQVQNVLRRAVAWEPDKRFVDAAVMMIELRKASAPTEREEAAVEFSGVSAAQQREDFSTNIPTLTIVSHPVARRAGERLLLHTVAAGGEAILASNAPDFTRPDRALGQPLGDLFVSPIRFAPGADGGVRVLVDRRGTLVVDGAPVDGSAEFTADDLAHGVALELADRVVLLLHWADRQVEDAADPLGMVGASAAIRQVRTAIERVVNLTVPVLIRGETGTGKELVARAIHDKSPHRNGPFVTVNLGAIPREIAAAELFGWVRGAFAGASRDRDGLFRAAHGGTLFLDEVGEAPPEVQVMLLRVLETGQIRPIGAVQPVAIQVRLIAAANVDLEEQIRRSQFKAPLLHRLAGFEIRLPPLRERRDDIGPLFYHFAREELEALGEGHRLSQDPYARPWLPAHVAAQLVRYAWPGNIRELRNVTRQLVIESRGLDQVRLDPRLANQLGMVARPSNSGPLRLPSGPAIDAPQPASDPVIVSAEQRREDFSTLVPALTIVSHPVMHRAGERLVLDIVAAGGKAIVSKDAPAFTRPGRAQGHPLGDPFASPIQFVPGADGGVRVLVDRRGTPVVARTPVDGSAEFTADDLAHGIALELADRVVLLLHWVDRQVEDATDPLGIVGASTGIQRVRTAIKRVVDLAVPVLIRGESGTGRELVAYAIHDKSSRRSGPFVTVNLGAIPPELAAVELFGSTRGAYAGASRDRIGLFRTADGGTLFLDEVGETPLEVQAMLLRVLETGEIYPIGSERPRAIQVRLIAAADANLEEQIRRGQFKAPLLHRLAGFEVRLPPLRERRDDIGLLFHHFAREELEALGEGHRLSQDPYARPWLPAHVAAQLVRYAWPGNIRELHNVARQLVIESRGLNHVRLDPRLANQLGMVARPSNSGPLRLPSGPAIEVPQPAPDPAIVPALTIVSHPATHRAGERLLLHTIAAGSEAILSSDAPDFTRPDRALGQPLGDLFVSPIRFAPGADGGVRVLVDRRGTLVVDGAPVDGSAEFTADDLAHGVALELADRVVLLLHWVDRQVEDAADPLGMVGASAAIRRVRTAIERVVDLTVPVLIRGETGTGKELVARAIHDKSPHCSGPFVTVNLGAIPRGIAAAELFGSIRGAFAGASRDRDGLFRAAHGGTLFLDEVGEAPPEVQVMLLRVLETGQIRPIGADRPVAIQVRLIAAANADLEEQIQRGQFKAPLLHRLAGFEIRLPPLRERRDDIGPLFYHFAREELEALGEGHRLSPQGSDARPWLPAHVAAQLVRYAWPGNIRELRNVTRQLVIESRGLDQVRLDPRLANQLGMVARPSTSGPLRLPSGSAIDVPQRASNPAIETRRKPSDVTESELQDTLRACAWDLKVAADRLRISRSSIYGLVARSPHIRTAGDLGTDEIAQCFRSCAGELDAMVAQLQVSRRALSRRLRKLGLASR